MEQRFFLPSNIRLSCAQTYFIRKRLLYPSNNPRTTSQFDSQPGRGFLHHVFGKNVQLCGQPHKPRALGLLKQFLKINLFIYLFILAALDLRCCAQTFSSCSKRGILFIAVRWLLIAVASLVAEHGLQAHGLQQLWHAGSVVVARRLQSAGSVVMAHGLSCSAACEIFPDQGSTCVPCIGRRILNHCATREVPKQFHLEKQTLNRYSIFVLMFSLN